MWSRYTTALQARSDRLCANGGTGAPPPGIIAIRPEGRGGPGMGAARRSAEPHRSQKLRLCVSARAPAGARR
eukprot:5330492-Alexandrium_andersonii.AAC.1